MMTMKLKNDFPPEVRSLFTFQNYCMECMGNQMIELHHILGRTSNSPLNAYVLCHKCHEKGQGSWEKKAKRLRQTLYYLVEKEYVFTDKDRQFYQNNGRYYINK